VLVEQAEAVFALAEFLIESAWFPGEYGTELLFPASQPRFNRTDFFRLAYLLGVNAT
jgi:hypothetical protein